MLNTIGIHYLNSLPVIFFKRPQQWRDPLQLQSYSYRLNESFSSQNYAADLQGNNSPMLNIGGTDDDAFYADKFAPEFSRYAPQTRVELVPDPICYRACAAPTRPW
jgi:non-heme chloroperoxidase